MLVLCKTKDVVSGSELFIAHIVTVTLTRVREMKYALTQHLTDYRCHWTNLGQKKHLKILTSISSFLIDK